MPKPTIIDVAREAGVSKSLVSLVLRDSPKVSDDAREAVLSAIEALDYRPNAMARSLARRRSNAVGVLLSDLHNPFFAEVLDGIDARAGERGYDALVNTGHRSPDGEARAMETLLELRMDGLILAAPRIEEAAIVRAAASAPVVLVSRASGAAELDSVTNDDRAGAALAVDHLVGLGHRRVAHVDGGSGAGADERRTGYEEAMRGHGLAAETRTVDGDYTEEGGARGAEELLAGGPPPTAVFAANDVAAIGVKEVLERAGLEVPGDVSLVGYDNTALAGLRHVDLTTVDQPRFEMGATAVELLLERLEDDRERPRHLVLQPSLVARGSTAPPRDE